MPADRLFRHFILRHMLQERVRTATTVVGIALGVGVVVAIQLTNQSSVRGFETALETVAGKATVELVANGGIDETLLPSLAWLREIGAASPVLEGEAAIVADEASGSTRRLEALRVLGVDILRDVMLRDYVVAAADRPAGASDRLPEQPELTEQQFLELLTSPQSIVITEKLARRRSLALGSTLRLLVGDRVQPFVVRGLLADQGPARVMDGSFVLMDIAAAQLAFDKLGRLDRIDVMLARGPGSPAIDNAIETISKRLPPGLTAQRPARRGEQVERMLAAFHLNLTALSWVALVVGLFLVYNTVTISVIARREEIGTLRALGVTKGRIQRLFLGEAAALGTVGTVLGIGAGRLLADAALGLTSTTVSTLYIATAAAAPSMTWPVIALAFAVGVPLSLLAAWLPAQEAGSVPPTNAIRGQDRLEPRVRVSRTALAGGAAVLGVAYILAQLGPVNGRPLFGYASSFATLIGASLLVPAILFLLSRLGRTPLRSLAGVEGLLAHANLSSAIPRLSISIAALALSLSMMVAVAVMIGSFRDTVAYWVNQTLQADLFIGSGRAPAVGTQQTLSPDVIDLVSRHPQVAAVDSLRRLDIVYEDAIVILGAGQLDVLSTHGSLLFREPSDGQLALRRAIDGGAVIVSEAFANRHGKSVGDQVSLETPQGRRTYQVSGVYYDYAADRGAIIMHRPTLERDFGRVSPASLAVYLRTGADVERVRQELLDRVADLGSNQSSYRVFISTNSALRQEVLRIFDSTFAITYALEMIAVTVAMLGVAATLLTLVIERRREIAMLRLIGAARRQVQRVVVIEAAIIGAASQAIGLAVGLALSLLLVHVINVQSFGWTIQFSVPYMFLLQVSVVVVIATSIAGLVPARRAAQLVVAHDE